MKALLAVLLFSQMALCNEAPTLQKLCQKYVDAFETRNLKEIKKLSTPNFFKATGGEQGWKERFGSLQKNTPQKKSKLRVKDFKMAQDTGHTYVRFRAGDPMPTGQWFVVLKKHGRWYLEDIVNDFEPKSKEPGG